MEYQLSRPQGTRDVKIPVFYGSDPISWIAKAELIFEFYQTPEHHKVLCAMVSMEGPALLWMYWKRSIEPDMDWATFRRALIKRFEEKCNGSIIKQLASLSQTSSIDKYIDEFVRLAPHLTGVSEEEYVGLFMKGLSPEIRTEVGAHRPTRVDVAMDLARDVEEMSLNKVRVHYEAMELARDVEDMNMNMAPWSSPFPMPLSKEYNDVDSWRSIDKMVLKYLQQPSSCARECGVHRDEIAQALKVSQEKLTEALENLEREGCVYNTIDENHYLLPT